jgi:hypothetical protein
VREKENADEGRREERVEERGACCSKIFQGASQEGARIAAGANVKSTRVREEDGECVRAGGRPQ